MTRVPIRLPSLHRRARVDAGAGPLDGQPDVSGSDRALVERALPYTMTGVPRLLALVDSVRYCVGRRVPGAFVECGVWNGGASATMAAAMT